MRIINRFFESVLGRRLFFMFVAGSLIPICLLALLSSLHVSRRLNRQNITDLKQSTESYAFSLYERLLILDNDLKTAASLLETGGKPTATTLPGSLKKRLRLHFRSIILADNSDTTTPLLNRDIPFHLPADLRHTSSDESKTRIRVLPGEKGRSKVYLLRKTDQAHPPGSTLIALVDDDFLWDREANRSLPFSTSSCILYNNTILYASNPAFLHLQGEIHSRMGNSHSGSFTTVLHGEKYLATHWNLFLKSDFNAPSWQVVLFKSARDILQPVRSFQTTFLLVVGTTIMLILLLSLNAIQRVINPLEKLKEATGRIAARDFSRRVEVTTRDEFGELAAAFNVMSGEIDRQFAANAKLLRELRELNWGSLIAFSRTVDAKSPWTAGHSARVTKIALDIAGAMGFSERQRDNLHRGSLLHDIGKIGIPLKLLDKPGKLSPEEIRTIRDHPAIGARILEPIKAYRDIIPLVRQHHERWDGKGYPEGLRGEEISLGGRILAVADTYDACVSDRPYRRGMKPQTALEILRKEAGKQFDPEVVRVFLSLSSHQEHGTDR